MADLIQGGNFSSRLNQERAFGAAVLPEQFWNLMGRGQRRERHWLLRWHKVIECLRVRLISEWETHQDLEVIRAIKTWHDDCLGHENASHVNYIDLGIYAHARLMEGHSGSAKAKIQCWIISTTKQATSIKLATTVGLFMRPRLWKCFLWFGHLVSMVRFYKTSKHCRSVFSSSKSQISDKRLNNFQSSDSAIRCKL